MAASGDNNEPNLPEDEALDSLEQRIEATRKAEDERLAKSHPEAGKARSTGMQVISTMVGYPLGGIIVGWGLDEVFGTHPWIMIVLMFMAFAGAFMHVIQANKGKDS